MSGEDERMRLLTTMPGVGYYVAALIVSEVGDVGRFGPSERLCSYAGLVPSVRNSGDSVRHGGITKTGSRWMRWALVQAVHTHVRYDTELSRFYRRLSGRKTKQEAVVATARKMLKVMIWMLLEGEPYHSGGEGAGWWVTLEGRLRPRPIFCGLTALFRCGALGRNAMVRRAGPRIRECRLVGCPRGRGKC